MSTNGNAAHHAAHHAATAAFHAVSGINATRLVQRGRDPETARLMLELADGTIIKVGTIERLLSRAQFDRVAAVTCGRLTNPCTPAEWKQAVGALVRHATAVTETPDETLAARIDDWLDQYAAEARSDRDGAAKRREPFLDDQRLHVHAEHFTRWLKREYSEAISAIDVRSALSDLGYEPARVDYTTTGRGTKRTRTTARYFRAPETSEDPS